MFEEINRLSKQDFNDWVAVNVTMDLGEPCHHFINGPLPSLDSIRNFSSQGIPLGAQMEEYQATRSFADGAIGNRLKQLGILVIEQGVQCSPSQLRLVEQARVIPIGNFAGDYEVVAMMHPHTADHDYDWDSYELKIAALRNWDKCCLFIGYRNDLKVMLGLRAARLLKDGIEYVVFINCISHDVYELVEDVIEDGSLSTDFDDPDPNAAQLAYYSVMVRYDEDEFHHRELPPSRLSRYMYNTYEWSRVNGKPLMTKISPYVGMPAKLADLFAKSRCMDRVREESYGLCRFLSFHYMHTWNIREFLDTADVLSFGLISEDPDFSGIDDEFGDGSPLGDIFLSYEADDIARTGVEIDADMNARFERMAEKIRGLAMAWMEDGSGSTSCVACVIADNRALNLVDDIYGYVKEHAPEGLKSCVECFWKHGVPVDDVFA